MLKISDDKKINWSRHLKTTGTCSLGTVCSDVKQELEDKPNADKK